VSEVPLARSTSGASMARRTWSATASTSSSGTFWGVVATGSSSSTGPSCTSAARSALDGLVLPDRGAAVWVLDADLEGVRVGLDGPGGPLPVDLVGDLLDPGGDPILVVAFGEGEVAVGPQAAQALERVTRQPGPPPC
jgi:hypothetical protein